MQIRLAERTNKRKNDR